MHEAHGEGLSSEEAQRRLAHYGSNVLPDRPPPGLLRIFFNQFRSPFIYILLVAALVSLGFDQIANAIFIAAVLLLNAGIGTVQEFSAQRAAQALKQLVRGATQVIRDGRAMRIDVEQLVPGDLVLLGSGDRVPADLRLIWSHSLSVDESQLTGESLPVDKLAGAVSEPEAGLAGRTGDLFAGCSITHGRARGLVMATGSHTELGRIASDVVQESVSEPPLMIRVRRFTYQVAGAILAAIAVLVAIMLWQGGYSLQAVAMMVIGLAVSTIPEGLPAALTVALAIGMRRMAQRNVIIRKLVAVETLGSCTLICSDKTGTLTVNELTIREVVLPDGVVHCVAGEGVAKGRVEDPDSEPLKRLVLAGLLANESHLEYAGGDWTSSGDIVDVAFLVLAKKLGLSLSACRARYDQIDLIPYESETAYSASLNHDGESSTLFVKGSPERVLVMCTRMRTGAGDVPLDAQRIVAQQDRLAAQGYRIIALAERSGGEATMVASDMTFLGLVAMLDPLRSEAAEAIRRCRAGGVEVAMVTGDHPITARAIAAQIGLCGSEDIVVTGDAMRAAAASPDDGALDELIRGARVFARIEPRQKQQIVDSFMRAGHFVAVTGDGVNDAPAMRRANAGVAMGKRGTDVAKESADLIITDDNFASIVSGIEQGRVVYNNIRKVVALLIATGFSALALFLGTALAGLPMPLTALQLLWLNLVANGLQDVALAFEPKEGDELDRAPRAPGEPIFDRHIIEHVLVVGSAMGVLAFSVFAWLVEQETPVEQARNLTLMLMILFGNIHALSARSETRSLFRMPLAGNLFLVLAVPLAQLVHIGASYIPAVQSVMQIQPVTLSQWSGLLAVALILLLVEEMHKWWLRGRSVVSSAQHR